MRFQPKQVGIHPGCFSIVEFVASVDKTRFLLEEMKKNADQKGITILLFPQKSTPKARKLAGVEPDAKTDEVDTRAIAQFLLKDNNAFSTLKEFKPTKLSDVLSTKFDSHTAFTCEQDHLR